MGVFGGTPSARSLTVWNSLALGESGEIYRAVHEVCAIWPNLFCYFLFYRISMSINSVVTKPSLKLQVRNPLVVIFVHFIRDECFSIWGVQTRRTQFEQWWMAVDSVTGLWIDKKAVKTTQEWVHISEIDQGALFDAGFAYLCLRWVAVTPSEIVLKNLPVKRTS